MSNTWFVADDNGHIIGHDMSEGKARDIASYMAEIEPDEGWEALEDEGCQSGNK